MSRLNGAARRFIELKRHALLRFRRSQSPVDWRCYKGLWNGGNIAVHREKVFLSTSLTIDSSLQFWKNLRVLSSAQSSASIPLHLRNLSLLDNHFLDSLPSSSYSFNSFTHLLFSFLYLFSTFNFAPITPSDLYSIFKRIRLTFAGSLNLSDCLLLLCFPQCLDSFLYMLNFSFSHSIFPSS